MMDRYIEIKPLDEEFLSRQEEFLSWRNDRMEVRGDCSHCKYCDTELSSREELRYHLLAHVKGQLEDCDACVNGFTTEGLLLKHVINHIESSLYDSCTYVTKSTMKSRSVPTIKLLERFVSKIATTENQNHNMDAIQKQGHDIDTTLTKGHDMDRTQNLDHPHKCNICEQRFKYKMELFKHMMVHVQKCSVCGKAVQKDSFPQHMLTHSHTFKHLTTGEWLSVCNVCCKAFSQKSDLPDHMLTHSGEWPFKCGLCEQGFSQKGHLVIHLKTHEAEEKLAKQEVPPVGDVVKDDAKAEFAKQAVPSNAMLPDSAGAESVEQDVLSETIVNDNAEIIHKCHVCGKEYAEKDMLATHVLSRHTFVPTLGRGGRILSRAWP